MRQKLKQKGIKYISIAVTLFLAVLFVAKFGGPSLLRFYVETGIGTCEKIPILCMAPKEEVIAPEINKEYVSELLPQDFTGMHLHVPRGFSLIKEAVKKIYYKKNKRLDKGAVMYLLFEEPNFFTTLFPQANKQGINDDYEFMRRTMYAKLKDIKNLADVFFVVMKCIFTPDLGDQKNVRMLHLQMPDRKGFINYNLAKTGNYFDCNIVNSNGNFFKVYIKDKGATLDLNKVFAIISTVDSIDGK
ncbi:MAG: hypothetical protein NTW64_01040 [Candidatus Omnitrophica bacterium]|nr:hypothetical protein [Candidatus Omnitrophota bacterium]